MRHFTFSSLASSSSSSSPPITPAEPSATALGPSSASTSSAATLVPLQLNPDSVRNHFSSGVDHNLLRLLSLEQEPLGRWLAQLRTDLAALNLSSLAGELDQCSATLSQQLAGHAESRLVLSVVAQPRHGKSTVLNAVHQLQLLHTVQLFFTDHATASVSFCAIELKYVPPSVCSDDEVIINLYWITEEELDIRRECLKDIISDPQARPGIKGKAMSNLKLLERAWIALSAGYQLHAARKNPRLFQSIRCPAAKVLTVVENLVSSSTMSTTGEPIDLRVVVERIHLHTSAFVPWSCTVDLPGVGDIDSLRARVAREYIQKSHHIWMLLPSDTYFNTNDSFQSSVTDLASDIMRSNHTMQLRSCEVILTCADRLTPPSANASFKEGIKGLLDKIIGEAAEAIDLGLLVVRGSLPVSESTNQGRYQLMDHVKPFAVSAQDYLVRRAAELSRPSPVNHTPKFASTQETNIPQLQEKLRQLIQDRAPIVGTVRELLNMILQLDAAFEPVSSVAQGSAIENEINTFLKSLQQLTEQAVHGWQSAVRQVPAGFGLPNPLSALVRHVEVAWSARQIHWRTLDSQRSKPEWLACHLIEVLRADPSTMALLDSLSELLAEWQNEYLNGVYLCIDGLCKKLYSAPGGRVQAPIFVSLKSTLSAKVEAFTARDLKDFFWTQVSAPLKDSSVVIQACQATAAANRGPGFMRNVVATFKAFVEQPAVGQQLHAALQSGFLDAWNRALPDALNGLGVATIHLATSRSQILQLSYSSQFQLLPRDRIAEFRASLANLRRGLLELVGVDDREASLQQWISCACPTPLSRSDSALAATQAAVLSLHTHHHLNFTHRIDAGFYFASYMWPGECWPLRALSTPNPEVGDELILFSAPDQDPHLNQIRTVVLTMLQADRSAQGRLNRIVEAAIGALSQHGFDETQAEEFERGVLQWRIQNNRNDVPIGVFLSIGKGRCRHRALLIKYLCDLTVLPSPSNITERTDPMCNAVWARVLHGVAVRPLPAATPTNSSSSSSNSAASSSSPAYLHMWNVVTYGPHAGQRLYEVETMEPELARRITPVSADSRRDSTAYQRRRGALQESLRGVGAWTITLSSPNHSWQELLPAYKLESQQRTQQVALMSTQQQVCVKRSRDMSDAAQLALVREANFLFALAHRNIIPLYGTINTSEADLKAKQMPAALMTHFIPGRTLSEMWTEKHIAWWATLSPLARERLALQIVVAVEACHDLSIVHGDISAGNVRISDDGSTAYLIDFEEARYIGTEPLPSHEFGRNATQPYAAPELIRRNSQTLPWAFEAAAAVDAYALALVVAEFITGSKIPMLSNPADCIRHIKDIRDEWRHLLLPYMRVQPAAGALSSSNRPRPMVSYLAQRMRNLVGDE